MNWALGYNGMLMCFCGPSGAESDVLGLGLHERSQNQALLTYLPSGAATPKPHTPRFYSLPEVTMVPLQVVWRALSLLWGCRSVQNPQ